MASSGLVEHCVELLGTLGPVRAKRMFGGWGLYADEVFVALIAFERLYLKADDASRQRFVSAGCEPFVYEARGKRTTMGYFAAPADAMDSPAAMAPWARLALQAALAARSAKLATFKRAAAKRARPASARKASATTNRGPR